MAITCARSGDRCSSGTHNHHLIIAQSEALTERLEDPPSVQSDEQDRGWREITGLGCELSLFKLQLRKERGTDPLYAEAWRWRENLQRAIDGCHTTDEMSSAGLAAYSELKGPNMPLSCGYSVSSTSTAPPMF